VFLPLIMAPITRIYFPTATESEPAITLRVMATAAALREFRPGL
jgi:hypothetical protein